MSRTSSVWLLAPVLCLASAATVAPPEKVQLTIGTIHAAALTKARAPGDTLDAPFLIVSQTGPQAAATSMLPDTGQLRIRLDQALGARPLAELSLAPGDSIEVTLSLLESAGVTLSAEARAAALSSKPSRGERVEHATQMVGPFLRQGANWIGSVNLLITNEAGTIFWRRLDCLKTCTVLSSPPTTALPATRTAPAIGVLEFSGSGGLYHLQLSANRAP